jgi:hypothetical protein
VMRRALRDPELRALFLQTLDACARAASDGWWASMLNRVASLIDPDVRADTRKPFSNDEYDAALAQIRDFLATRPAYVLQQVETLRR